MLEKAFNRAQQEGVDFFLVNSSVMYDEFRAQTTDPESAFIASLALQYAVSSTFALEPNQTTPSTTDFMVMVIKLITESKTIPYEVGFCLSKN